MPIGFRIASAFSVLLVIFALLCLLERGSVMTIFGNNGLVTWVTWIFTVYFGIGIMMNFVSQSKVERTVMTPFATVLFGLFLTVSLTAG